MKVGLNLGNTLEAICGENAWGNRLPLRPSSIPLRLLDLMQFGCQWHGSAISDTNTYVIDEGWIACVKEVVDYCINESMFVIINIHWISYNLE
jgi:hypothetical protein